MRMPKRAVATNRTRLAGAERVAFAVLSAGVLVVPTILAAGSSDPFRAPKELAFRAEAIVLLAVAVFWATARRRTWHIGRGAAVIAAAAIVGWAVVATAASTNRLLSVDSLATVVAAAVIFLATYAAAQTASLVAVDVLMVACCANAALVIVQELKLWSPFTLPVSIGGHYGSVALLGNANDVGMFLLAPAVAAIVMTVTAAGARRWIYAAVSALLAAGIVASGTRTALVALVAALIVFALVHSRRAALAVAVLLVLLAVPLLSRTTMMGRGLRDLADAAAKRDYQRLLSERLLPFLAAADMTRDHPLLGVGPGCFKYHYMAYRVALAKRHPLEWTRGWPMNWGEVHNDHLQVASETGLPGYALFLGAIGVGVGLGRRHRAPPTAPRPPAAAYARALRWPLAAGIFVICLAQFPLELAAPRLMLLTLGALCMGWDRDDAP